MYTSDLRPAQRVRPGSRELVKPALPARSDHAPPVKDTAKFGLQCTSDLMHNPLCRLGRAGHPDEPDESTPTSPTVGLRSPASAGGGLGEVADAPDESDEPKPTVGACCAAARSRRRRGRGSNGIATARRIPTNPTIPTYPPTTSSAPARRRRDRRRRRARRRRRPRAPSGPTISARIGPPPADAQTSNGVGSASSPSSPANASVWSVFRSASSMPAGRAVETTAWPEPRWWRAADCSSGRRGSGLRR